MRFWESSSSRRWVRWSVAVEEFVNPGMGAVEFGSDPGEFGPWGEYRPLVIVCAGPAGFRRTLGLQSRQRGWSM